MLRAEIKKKFCSFFGSNENKKICLGNLLTFRKWHDLFCGLLGFSENNYFCFFSMKTPQLSHEIAYITVLWMFSSESWKRLIRTNMHTTVNPKKWNTHCFLVDCNLHATSLIPSVKTDKKKNPLFLSSFSKKVPSWSFTITLWE